MSALLVLGLLVLIAVLVPRFGADSRRSGGWTVGTDWTTGPTLHSRADRYR